MEFEIKQTDELILKGLKEQKKFNDDYRRKSKEENVQPLDDASYITIARSEYEILIELSIETLKTKISLK